MTAPDHAAAAAPVLPVTNVGAWTVLAVLLAVVLALDLFVFHRRSHAIRLREALLGSAAWISLALLFNLGVLATRGATPAVEFLTGYIIELSLSVDNLFVFLLLFRDVGVPAAHQHKVLFWGILGAVVMRLAFIVAGVTLLRQFHWIIYVFGGVLIWSGIRMASHQETEIDPARNPVLRLARRWLPIAHEFHGDRFFIRQGTTLLATPLFLTLIMVEVTDLVFAVDSIPAVLAITQDPFIVFSSNIFAILGLRAMFFSLAGVMDLFHYLHFGLSAILVFVGVKMVLSDILHVPTPIALGVVGGILAICIIASIVHQRRAAAAAPGPDSETDEKV